MKIYRHDRFSAYALFVLFVGSWGGFMLGFHAASISGILPTLTDLFSLSVFQQGYLVSQLLLGGLVGSLAGGYLADGLGRKRTMLFTALLFIVGDWLQMVSHSYETLLWGRLIAGFAVGVISVVSPLYLAEIAPPHYRGRFVSLFQLMITLGILFAYQLNVFFASEEMWRNIFLVSLIAAACQFVTLFFSPESPAWLLRHKEKREAVDALKELRDDKEWKSHLPEMTRSADRASKGLNSLWRPPLRRVVFVGVALSAFQQISGINAVIYYAPNIFTLTGGISSDNALIATVIVGAVNSLATLGSVLFLDKLGRRKFLLIGVAIMLISQLGIILGFVMQNEFVAILALVSVLAYVAGFAISLGPILWVVLSEIYPLKIRGQALGIALFVNWLTNYLVVLTFLIFINKMGIAGTFCLYGVITLITLIFIYRYIPETKGKSLEEIEEMVNRGAFKP